MKLNDGSINFDESNEKLNKILKKLSVFYSRKFDTNISPEIVFNALFIFLENIYLNEENFFILMAEDVIINYQEAKELLKHFDFKTFLVSIEIDDSIFPFSFLYKQKQQIKISNNIWRIHKTDKDTFPSEPHAHDIQRNLKLDLSKGDLYQCKKYIGTIPRKSLIEIRKKFEQKNVIMPVLK